MTDELIQSAAVRQVKSRDGSFEYKPIMHPAACDECSDGVLDIDVDEGMGEKCSTCGADGANCSECGAVLAFDATMRGTTCGGLDLVGWRVCACGAPPTLCRRSMTADAIDWRLAGGGRSLHAGPFKVRVEAGGHRGGDVTALMARLVRVPELEAEVERLRAELARRKGA